MKQKRGVVFVALTAALALGVSLVFSLQKSPAKRQGAHRQSAGAATGVSAGEKFVFDNNDAAKSLVSSPPVESKRDGQASFEDAMEPFRGNVVVSFGKVEDIGQQAGYILPLLAEMRSLAAGDPSRLTPGQRNRLLDLQRRYAGLLGVLPEIAGFQNNPAEYGKFFSNMARQAAGLNASQTARVDDYMRARANEMIQAGLNDAKKPSDAAQMDDWESRRDRFNEQTVAGLRQVLTPELAARAGFDEQTMELFETDFDKARLQPALN